MMINTFGFKKNACIVPLVAAICFASAPVWSATVPATKKVQADLHVVVKPGDTLTSIVFKETGLIDLWPEVQAHNKISAPDSLSPGDVIIIPWDILQLRNFAKVVFFKGEATLLRKGEATPAQMQKGDKIHLGDVIQTGVNGYVSLTFKGDSSVNIQPESRILLQELECFDTEKACQVELNSTSGQMRLKVKNVGFSKTTKFIIDTPYASAAVRGTEFDFATAEGNVIGVTEGAVDLSVNNRSVNVPMGKGVLAGEGQSIDVLYDLLPKPEFNKYLRISAEDTLSWKPIEGAASYKIVLAESGGMTDIIQSSIEQGTLLSGLLDLSQYYIKARAVAKNGIKGFYSQQLVEHAKIDTNVPAPELNVELSGSTLTIKSAGRFTTEVHIGDSLVAVDELETLVSFTPYDVAPGESLTLQIDGSKDIYLTARAVIDQSTVSSYGSLYEFKSTGK